MSVCITTSGFQMLYVPPPGPPLNLSGIAVSGGSGSTPSAISALTITQQGGGSANLTNRQALAWTAATAGSNPISYYRVYANGTKVSTDGAVTGTTFIHSTATNSNVPTLDAQATGYFYQVSAVDSQGNEGPLSTDLTIWMYQGANGGSTCSNSDFSFGMVSEDYADTTGSPVGGGTDVKLVYPAPNNNGGWQPYSSNPLVPQYDLELGGLTSGGGGFAWLDVKPMQSGNVFFFGLISRFPFGDIFNWKGPSDISAYVISPTPGVLTVGQWNTCKFPLPACSIGDTTFVASIGAPYGSDASGPWATMTVTQKISGVDVDYGGYVVSGAPAGTRIGIQSVIGNHATVASWQVQGPGITGSTVVPSTQMVSRRTNMYKGALGNNSGNSGGTVYTNNLKYTRL